MVIQAAHDGGLAPGATEPPGSKERLPAPSAGCLQSLKWLRPICDMSPCREKNVQETAVQQNGNDHNSVGPRAFHQIQIDQHAGEAEADDPGIEAHADATE